MPKKISELTAASGASSTSPVPMVQGGATLGIEAGLLVRSSTSLGNMQTLVQTLIDTASVADRNRGNHTGQMAASNVDVAYNGKTVEACITEIYAALAGGGPSAPTIASVPTIAGTPAVGQTLTATANSEPANTTTTWKWNEDGAQISGATASTLNLQSAQLGKYITVTQRSTNTTGGLYSESTSAATAVVTGTVPSNTLAPSISPSGSQAVGQTHTVSTGVWDNASTYGIQFYYAGVPEGVRSATTTITPDASKAGLTLTFDVIGYSSIGVASAPVAGSNSVTLTGTAAVVNVTPPVWDTNLYFGVTNDFAEGVWTGSINAARTWEFFRNSETVAYVSPPNTLSLHTPRSPAVVGDTLYIEETVTETATGNTFKARSTGKVIASAPATLAVALTAAGSAGYTWTAGSSIPQANPSTITGGTSPYVATIANLTWATVTVSGGNVYINGTPPSAVSSTTRTISVTDSAASPATVTVDFTMQVNAASVTPMSSLAYPVPSDFSPTNTWGDYAVGDTVTINGKTKLSRVSDPGGSGQLVYLHRVYKSDSGVSGTATSVSNRSEKVWIDSGEYMFAGEEHWFAFAFRPKSGEWPTNNPSITDDEFLIFQTHSESSGDTGPPISLGIHVGLNSMKWKTSWGAASQATTKEGETTLVTQSLPAVDVWRKIIIHFRPGYSQSFAPRTEIWESVGGAAYAKIADSTANTDYNWNTGSYPRIGTYKWSGTNWDTNPSSIACYMTTLYHGEGANLYAQAEAALAGL